MFFSDVTQRQNRVLVIKKDVQGNIWRNDDGNVKKRVKKLPSLLIFNSEDPEELFVALNDVCGLCWKTSFSRWRTCRSTSSYQVFLTIWRNVLAWFVAWSVLQCFIDVNLAILQRQVLRGKCGELSTWCCTAGK